MLKRFLTLGPPAFWQHGTKSVLPALLSPIEAVVTRAASRRAAGAGWKATVPVICCGNVTIGGGGKTTLALDLAARLKSRGLAVHFLTRGYRGTAQSALRVDPLSHTAGLVGDEALLLAASAPTWIGGDRSQSARLALAAGAEILVMDDGLQNPTLHRSFTFLAIDGPTGFGNGHVLPAGPLREPVAAALRRVQAAIMIGDDDTAAQIILPTSLPVLRASLKPDDALKMLTGKRLFAFGGIARPAKFFAMLEQAGMQVAGTASFADHHPYSPAELRMLRDKAHQLGAVAVTTPKDTVRIPAGERAGFQTIGVSLAWQDEAALEHLLTGILG